MAIQTVADLMQVLRQYRLLETPQLDECAKLQPKYTDARALARELVQRKWLTPYQVNQLFKGQGADLLMGAYVLLEKLGEGGMGQVFKARNLKMDRVVALKVIRKEKLANPTAVRRFQREIRAAAQLHHSNIVMAFDADTINDQHFIAMEYVEGIDLNKLVKQSGPLPIEQACDYIRQAALGLQHACERGLVHRDIKPSNLLVNHKLSVAGGNSTGSMSAAMSSTGLGATLKILDMGLARLHGSADEDGSGTLTQDGTVVGTPDYLSPEQSRNSHNADIRSDLYSLGCTFYFLLVGKVPFPADTLSNKIWKHNFEEPAPAEERRQGVPPAVSAIVRKLMAKRPEDRFQTPAELVEALESAVRFPSKPISVTAALPAAIPMGAAALPQAIPVPQGSTGSAPRAILVPTATLVSGGSSSATPLSQALAFTETSLETPQVKRVRRKLPVRLLLLSVGGPLALGLVIICAVLLLRPGTRAKNRTPDGKLVEIPTGSPLTPEALVSQPALLKKVSSWSIETYSSRGTYTTHAFSPGSRWVVTGTDLGTIRFWEARTGKMEGVFVGPATAIHRLAFSPDGKVLAAGCEDQNIRLWEVKTGKLLHTSPTGAPVHLLAYSPDGSVLASNGADYKILFIDSASGKQVQTFAGHTSTVNTVTWSPDGSKMASTGRDRSVRVWNISTGKPIHNLAGHSNDGYTLAWSPDGTRLASGSADNSAYIWDITQGKSQHLLEGHTSYVVSVSWSPDGALLATGSSDGSARLWNTTSGKQKDIREKTGGTPAAFRWTNDGKPTPAKDGSVMVWEVESGVFVRVLLARGAATDWAPDGETLYIVSGGPYLVEMTSGKIIAYLPVHPSAWQPLASFSPNNKLMVTNNPFDATLRIWDTATGQMLRTLSGHTYTPSVLAWSPDGTKLATGGQDSSVRLWDPESGKLLDSYNGHKNAVNTLAWSPDGSKLASGSTDKTIHVWAIESGKSLDTFQGHTGAVYHVVWSPDGSTLASRGADEFVVNFWQLGSTKPTLTLKGHTAFVSSMAWSPDGASFATGSYDLKVRVWNSTTGQSFHTLEGHGNYINQVAWSRDGKKLASGSYDRTVWLWDVQSGRNIDKLQGHLDSVVEVNWLADGTTLAVRSSRQVKLWNTATGKPLRTFDGATSSYFSPDGKVMAGGYLHTLRFWETDSGRPKATLLFLRNDQALVINAEGNYRSIPRNLEELRYVVQTSAGQDTLNPKEFTDKYGWTNDPERVRLTDK